jgi:hypothetical protein
MAIEPVSNQIFLGIPWRNTKAKYERIRIELIKKYPLSFIIIGREPNQTASDLLEEIKNKIRTSDFTIFDATYGNSNVSLEFGFAEGLGIRRMIYLRQHGRTQSTNKDRAIISDLGGKRYSPYTTEATLKTLLTSFSKKHEYTIKFERYMNQFHNPGKLRRRNISLKIIHEFDEKTILRKSEIAQRIQDEQPGIYSDGELIESITSLKDFSLLGCKGGGPNPDYWIEQY